MKENEDDLINEKENAPNEEVKQEIDAIKLLTNQNAELNDKLLRNMAELQNYKRRKEEEVERLLRYCEEDIILDILPIVDNFERAIRLDESNSTNEVSNFLQGFKMIYGNLIEILNKYEVKEIDALGKEFDSKYHQAVLTDTVDDKENNIVLEVLQKGYMYKDKVIRPAMVKVNTK